MRFMNISNVKTLDDDPKYKTEGTSEGTYIVGISVVGGCKSCP